MYFSHPLAGMLDAISHRVSVISDSPVRVFHTAWEISGSPSHQQFGRKADVSPVGYALVSDRRRATPQGNCKNNVQ